MHKDYIKYQDVKTTFISDNDGNGECKFGLEFK